MQGETRQPILEDRFGKGYEAEIAKFWPCFGQLQRVLIAPVNFYVFFQHNAVSLIETGASTTKGPVGAYGLKTSKDGQCSLIVVAQ